jgi:hypothetical protein
MKAETHGLGTEKVAPDGRLGIDPVLLIMGTFFGFLITLIVAAGESYESNFFYIFGIDVHSIEKADPSRFSSISSGIVSLIHNWPLSLAYVGLLLIFSVYFVRDYQFVLRSIALFPMFIVFICLGYVGAVYCGKWHGQAVAESLDQEKFPAILLTVKTENVFTKLNLQKEGELCLRKIYMDKSKLYIYVGYKNLSDYLRSVYIVPLSEVTGMRVVQGTPLCQDALQMTANASGRRSPVGRQKRKAPSSRVRGRR